MITQKWKLLFKFLELFLVNNFFFIFKWDHHMKDLVIFISHKEQSTLIHFLLRSVYHRMLQFTHLVNLYFLICYVCKCFYRIHQFIVILFWSNLIVLLALLKLHTNCKLFLELSLKLWLFIFLINEYAFLCDFSLKLWAVIKN